MQTFDPGQLVRDVVIHLQLQGLDPEVQSNKDAEIAASKLLRSLGITPAMAGVDALARSMDKPWSETDGEESP